MWRNRETPACSVCAKSLQSGPTLRDPMDCSPPGSSVHGILQARILEWVAISFSRGSSWPRDRTCIPYTAGGFFTTEPPRKPHPYFRDKETESQWYEIICLRAQSQEETKFEPNSASTSCVLSTSCPKRPLVNSLELPGRTHLTNYPVSPSLVYPT